MSSTTAAQCQATQIPIVLYNRVPAADQRASSVTGNNIGGARVIASFLVSADHKRIAFIRGLRDSSTNQQRELGFIERLGELGQTDPLIETGNFNYEEACAATR